MRNSTLYILYVYLIFTIYPLLSMNGLFAEPIQENNDRKNHFINEIKLGVLVHDPDHLWSQHRKEEGLDLNAEVIFSKPTFKILKGTIRPNAGISINTQGDTSKIYAGFLWEYVFEKNFFLNLGIGGAIHDGELETENDNKKELGSRVLFRIPIEIGYIVDEQNRISLAFDHISNGGLVDENEGFDTIGIRYGYTF